MSIWYEFGLIMLGVFIGMAIGMVIAYAFNWLAWRKYYEGKREGMGYKRKDN